MLADTVCGIRLIQRHFVFVRHKGQPIFAQLLRCEALDVGNYAFAPRSLHLRKPEALRPETAANSRTPWAVRKAG